MRFSKVTFTHPLSIKFMSDDNGAGVRQVHSAFAHDVGSVSTLENQTSPAVDSIEAVDQWVVIRWNGQTKCVPAAKVESADMAEPAPTSKGKAA
jgi:predicted RNA-binding protein with PUA domain